MSIAGLPGQGPVRAGIPIADLTAGLFAAQGIMVALLGREHSDRGRWLHTSLLQAQIFMPDFQAARWLVDGDVPGQAGNDHPTGIPTEIFRCSDGEINISVTGKVIWQRFCDVLGRMDLFEHEDCDTEEKRSENRDALSAEIDRATRARPTAYWVDTFNAAGVPCRPIFSIDQTFADEHVRHLNVTDTVPSKALGAMQFVKQPVSLERMPSSFALAPPDC